MSHLRDRWWACLCLAALVVPGGVAAIAGSAPAEEKTAPMRMSSSPRARSGTALPGTAGPAFSLKDSVRYGS